MDSRDQSMIQPARGAGISRREVIGLGAAALLGGGISAVLPRITRDEGGRRAEVFIGKAPTYDTNLFKVVEEGLTELGVSRDQVRGKRIVLKPNLVETAPGKAHINTNPAVIVAVAEAFRRLDAAEITVAEGQGHRRDSWLVLDESGMGAALDEAKLPFVDLNHDDLAAVPNAGRWTELEPLYLPQTLLRADWVISVPKLKTHHWTGVTCAMKNLFGVMPGIVYGWPKNLLHYAGINKAILDINATVKPLLAIVDGVVGMEGDGPIMGTPKQVGCIVMGRNLPAVDATCVRLMDLNPYAVGYLTRASGRLGPIHEEHIAQRGEGIATLQSRFKTILAPNLKDIAKR